MPTVHSSQNWILGLGILIATLALLVGVLSTGTDLLNINTSAAEAKAIDAKTQVETEKAEADVAAYRAQKEAEIASAEAAVQAQRQAAAFQAFKSIIDQEFYLVGKATGALRQRAEIEIYKAQQLAQTEVTYARQIAEIKAWEEHQAQNRAQDQAQAVQDMENARLITYGLLAGGGVIVMTLAVGIVIVAIRLAKNQTVAKPAAPTQAEEAAETEEDPQAINENASGRAYWLERRHRARANEIAFNTLQIAEPVARGPTSNEVGQRGNGKRPASPRHASTYARK